MPALPKPIDQTPEAGVQAGLPGIGSDMAYIPKGKGKPTQASLEAWGKLQELRKH